MLGDRGSWSKKTVAHEEANLADLYRKHGDGPMESRPGIRHSKVAPDSCQVAIIGAGPYGLSIAAHLRARGIELRIFGTPMDSWRTRMPMGMFLKSEGFASNLDD